MKLMEDSIFGDVDDSSDYLPINIQDKNKIDYDKI